MNMMFNARIFEDLSQNLAVLGEMFSAQVPRKSKDPLINLTIQEARLHAFMTSHTSFGDLLRSIYEQSDISKKEGSDPKNAAGEVLTWLYRQRTLTAQQVTAFAEQFESATVLSYDSGWLEHPEEKKLFNERYAKISRYHYMMNIFVGALTKKVSFIDRRPDNAQA